MSKFGHIRIGPCPNLDTFERAYIQTWTHLRGLCPNLDTFYIIPMSKFEHQKAHEKNLSEEKGLGERRSPVYGISEMDSNIKHYPNNIQR